MRDPDKGYDNPPQHNGGEIVKNPRLEFPLMKCDAPPPIDPRVVAVDYSPLVLRSDKVSERAL